MRKKESKTMIGAFVVGAIRLGVVGVLLLGGGSFLKKKYEMVMYFEGTVQGLNIGAPVLLKGVRLGEVNEIKLHYISKAPNFRTKVLAEFFEGDSSIEDPEGRFESAIEGGEELEKVRRSPIKGLIKDGLRAQLTSQSMVTGQLMVTLDFFPESTSRSIL